MKSPYSEKYIQPITILDEMHQRVLMHLFQNLIEEFAPITTNEIDISTKEKRLLDELDHLESENFCLSNQLIELSKNKEDFDKKINEMKDIISLKETEIKKLIKEKEELHTQVN